MGGGSYTIKGIIETLNSWKNQKNISPPSQLYKNRINLIHRMTPTSTFLLYVGEWIVSQDFYNFHP